jgi:hypothetical protein
MQVFEARFPLQCKAWWNRPLVASSSKTNRAAANTPARTRAATKWLTLLGDTLGGSKPHAASSGKRNPQTPQIHFQWVYPRTAR